MAEYAEHIMNKRFYMNNVSEFQIMTQSNVGISIDKIMNSKYYELESNFNTPYESRELNCKFIENDIEIIKQLMAGNHLEQHEIQRARELLKSLLKILPKFFSADHSLPS